MNRERDRLEKVVARRTLDPAATPSKGRLGHARGAVRTLIVVLAVTGAAFQSGCTVLGPAAIRNGRAAYNEAIRATEAQQMLNFVVRARYGESAGMLMVTNVAANMKFRVGANADFGIGPDRNYAGNLVPLSSGVAYEDNPTISYVPLQGDAYGAQLLGPVSLDMLALLLRSADRIETLIMALVSRVNNLRNPDFAPADARRDSRFQRFAKLMDALARTGQLQVVRHSTKGGFALYLRRAKDGDPVVSELLAALDIPEPETRSASLSLPLVLAAEAPVGSIAVTTRSIFDLAELMAASIELPATGEDRGRAVAHDGLSPLHAVCRIRRAESYPGDAYVAVRYRGAWYFIADSDLGTKQIFRLLQLLWSVRLSDNMDAHKPVLTIPVG